MASKKNYLAAAREAAGEAVREFDAARGTRDEESARANAREIGLRAYRACAAADQEVREIRAAFFAAAHASPRVDAAQVLATQQGDMRASTREILRLQAELDEDGGAS